MRFGSGYAAVALAACSWGTWRFILLAAERRAPGLDARVESAIVMLVITLFAFADPCASRNAASAPRAVSRLGGRRVARRRRRDERHAPLRRVREDDRRDRRDDALPRADPRRDARAHRAPRARAARHVARRGRRSRRARALAPPLERRARAARSRRRGRGRGERGLLRVERARQQTPRGEVHADRAHGLPRRRRHPAALRARAYRPRSRSSRRPRRSSSWVAASAPARSAGSSSSGRSGAPARPMPRRSRSSSPSSRWGSPWFGTANGSLRRLGSVRQRSWRARRWSCDAARRCKRSDRGVNFRGTILLGGSMLRSAPLFVLVFCAACGSDVVELRRRHQRRGRRERVRRDQPALRRRGRRRNRRHGLQRRSPQRDRLERQRRHARARPIKVATRASASPRVRPRPRAREASAATTSSRRPRSITRTSRRASRSSSRTTGRRT